MISNAFARRQGVSLENPSPLAWHNSLERFGRFETVFRSETPIKVLVLGRATVTAMRDDHQARVSALRPGGAAGLARETGRHRRKPLIR